MKSTLVLLNVLLSVATYAQILTGKIIDQQNQPVPFAMSLRWMRIRFLLMEMFPVRMEYSGLRRQNKLLY